MPNRPKECLNFTSVKNIFHETRLHKKLNDLLYALNESSIVAMTDSRGKITYANNKFCEISKFERQELIGADHRILNSGHHSKEFFKEMWSMISKGQIWKGEVKNKAKDGTFYWVFTTIVPLVNDAGQIREYISIRHDITDKKRIEERNELIQFQVLQSKINQESSERFVTTLTHDMRTPLTAAKLSAQQIERNINRPDFIKKYISKILVNIDRADEMITDLLNATKIRAGQQLPLELKECDLAEIAKRVVSDLSLIHSQKINLIIDGECVGKWSDTGIKRIIENLCNNAAKYGLADKEITVHIHSSKNFIELSVHNFGQIISPSETNNLFDYLQRTLSAQHSNKIGWGIGLTLVKGMTEAHGGIVEVRSTLLEGTTFVVKLPKKYNEGFCNFVSHI